MPRDRFAGRVGVVELGVNGIEGDHLHSHEQTLKYERTVASHSGFNEVAIGALMDAGESAEDYVERRELLESLFKAMEDLSEKNRIVVQKFYFEEYTVEEIARELDVSVSVVTSRLSEARKQLKGLLGD